MSDSSVDMTGSKGHMEPLCRCVMIQISRRVIRNRLLLLFYSSCHTSFSSVVDHIRMHCASTPLFQQWRALAHVPSSRDAESHRVCAHKPKSWAVHLPASRWELAGHFHHESILTQHEV